MPVHRKRFRVEEALLGEVTAAVIADGDTGPMHREKPRNAMNNANP